MSKEFVRFIFTYENKIRYAIYEKRFDNCLPKTGGNGHSRISDPTAQKAMQAVMPIGTVLIEYGATLNDRKETRTIKHPEAWMRVVDETYKFFDNKKQGEVLYARFKKGESRLGTCRRLGIKKSWYAVLLNDAMRHAEKLAEGAGLL